MALILPHLTVSGVVCTHAYIIVREVVVMKKAEHYEVQYSGAIFFNEEAYKSGFRAVERFREHRFELELDSIHNIIEQAYINLRGSSGFEYAEDDLKADEEE